MELLYLITIASFGFFKSLNLTEDFSDSLALVCRGQLRKVVNWNTPRNGCSFRGLFFWGKVVCDVFFWDLFGCFQAHRVTISFRERKKNNLYMQETCACRIWIQIYISDGCKLYCAHRDIEYHFQPTVAWWLRFVVYYCRKISPK